MKIGIFTRTFAGTDPATVLEAARSAGYQTVQYNMASSGLSVMPLSISDEIAEAVRAASVATGVEIDAVSATYNIIHPDLRERELGRRGLEAIAAAAHKMGTRLLTLCTGTCDPEDQWRYHPDNSTPTSWEEMCKEFRLLLAIADRHDVLLGVEPELANIISSARRARQLLDTFGNERIRIVLDGANLFEVASLERQHSLIDEAVELLGDSIAIAHAKDRLADGRFATAGTGVLDYRYYLSALERAGFRGSVIAHGLTAAEAPTVAEFLRGQLSSH